MVVIIFWDFLIFCQIFLSPQVKRGEIISIKNSICKLPHELLNDLRLRIVGNQEISRKSKNCTKLKSSPYYSSKNENFVNTSEKLLKTKYWTFPVVRFLHEI